MAKLPEMTVYYNQTLDITLSVPVGWTGKVLSPLTFRVFSPPEPDYNSYRATLSVEKIDLSEDAEEENVVYGKDALEELIAQAQTDLRSEMQDFQPLRDERYTSQDGLPAYSLWFTWQDPETGRAHSQIQAFLLTTEGCLYIFNAATLKPLENRYFSIFNHIIQSATIQV
jgi:hypothetical protein